MNSISATNVVQLLALLLSSGVLTMAIYQFRAFGLPDKAVPLVAHAAAVGVAILIALFDALATGHSVTADVVIAAILAGITGGFTASGIHGQVVALGRAKATNFPMSVTTYAGSPASPVWHEATPSTPPQESQPK